EGGKDPQRSNLQRLSLAIPSDHDDHDRGFVWHNANRPWIRRRRRRAPVIRLGGRRRVGRVAIADAIYHASDLLIPGIAPAMATRQRRNARATRACSALIVRENSD